MKRDLRTIVLITFLAALTLPQLALAQTYDLPAGVVGSGGGAATSASYSLSGTVGQPAADIGLSSASYKHDGGFWPAVQALVAPAGPPPGLAGSYAIGTGEVYPTFSDAVTDLVANGVSGPVTFNVISGTYTEQITIPEISGVSTTDTIVFQSASGNSTDVTLTYASTLSDENFTVRLDGADYFIFKNLTISATGLEYARIFEIRNSSCNNKFQDNHLIGVEATLDDHKSSLFYSPCPSNDTDNIFVGNKLEYGSCGFDLCGDGNNDYEKGIKIYSNEILNSKEGMELSYLDAPHVKGNLIKNDSNQFSKGISTWHCINQFVIEKNLISIPNAIAAFGIKINNSNSTDLNEGIVVNNLIHVKGYGGYCIGIEYVNSTYQKVLYNTVYSSGTPSPGLMSILEGTSEITILNNIFSAYQGPAISSDIISGIISDHNNLYSKTTSVGKWASVYRQTIEDWQVSSGLDANSISADPLFVDAATHDYHLRGDSPAIGAGDSISVDIIGATDIEGSPRPNPAGSNPDLGAYENVLDVPEVVPLAGIKTIDPAGSGPDNYTSFGAAVADLTDKGISASVNFQVKADDYNEQVTIGLITGASATNTITFEPHLANTDTVHLEYTATGTADNWVVKLDGSQYVTIRGLHLMAGDTTYARLLHITQNADNNQILDNVLTGAFATTSIGNRKVITVYGSPGSFPDNLTISGNTLEYGEFGLYASAPAGEYPTGLVIDGNTFNGQYYAAVQVSEADAPVVSNNHIIGPTGSVPTFWGVSLINCQNAMAITGNTIDVSQTNQGYPIRMADCNALVGSEGLVANNVIIIGEHGGHGIALSGLSGGTNNIMVFHNTVYNNGHNMALYIGSGSGIQIKNNVLVSLRTGVCVIETPSVVTKSNNNNLYSTSSVLVWWGGTSYSDLASLQAASGQFESSISADPLFVDVAAGDYHLQDSSPAIGAGDGTIIAPPIDFDIEGTSRPLPAGSQPDLGAYENTLSAPVLFTDAAAGLVGTFEGQSGWVDYDSDGDLDLLTAGYDGTDYITRLYRNDDGDFTDANAGLPGYTAEKFAWGDYDGDGDLDLLLNGHGSGQNFTTLYRNDWGVFSNAGAGLPGTASCAVLWGDYDNDGDLDILISAGYQNGIYRNDGGSFSRVDIGLPNLSNTFAAWGDYDNDGDLDLAVGGYDEFASAHTSVIYRNDGGGSFVDIGAGLIGVGGRGSAAWGDYDSDGDLDLLLTGQSGDGNVGYTRVFRNDDGAFTDIAAALPDLKYSSAVWGDYDNDGDLDVLLEGQDLVAGTLVTAIYRNDSGSFTDIGAGLPGTHGGSAAWGDYDNDGDLDLLLSGFSTDAGPYITSIYRNDGAVTNSPPVIPFSLTSSEGAGEVTLNWLAPATPDDHTPNLGLTYNLRVGTITGGLDIVSPHADATGQRRIPALGNVQQNTSWSLQGLLAGTYYWSVQAVDGAYAGGAWAEEQTFTVGVPPTVATGPAVNITSTSATLHARVNPHGDPTDVNFEWGTSIPYSNTTPADQGRLNTTVDVAVTALLPSLQLSTTYHYRVVAENTGGPSTGVDRTFTTPADDYTTVDIAVVTESGEVSFPGTNVTLGITFDLPGEGTIKVSQVKIMPGGTLPPRTELAIARYWEISYDGGGTFSNVEMTFILGAGVITSEDQANLGNLKLLRRANEASVSWDQVGSTLRATDSSVTFTGLASFSQYAVARLAPDTEAPSIDEPISIAPNLPVDVNSAVTVTAMVTDNSGDVPSDSVRLYYNDPGVDAIYTEVIMQPTAQAAQYSGTIPGSAVTVRGVVFYIRAADAAGNADISAMKFVSIKFGEGDLRTNVSGSAFAGGFPKDKWRLISIPANLTPNKSVDANIGDELGASSDTTWKIYAYTNNPTDPWREATSFVPGTCYWLYQRVENNIQLEATAGTSNDLESFPITVKPEWNLISNPYPFKLRIELNPVDYYGPITFTGSDTALIGWTGIKSELAPWGGYAVYNRTGADQTITLSAEPGRVVGKQLLAKGIAEQPEGWLLQLEAVGKTYADVANTVGRLAGATERLDYFDNPEPPYIDGFVSLAMERPDWGANLPRFTSDIRSLEDTDGVWDLALYVKDEQGPITLTPELQGNLPTGNSIVLFDVITREVHDLLADDRPVTITDYREDFPYRLKVVAGSASYVDQTTEKILAELPSKFALAQNYPNPFNPATHLRYSLIRPTRVTLKVYNLLGQEVVTLVDGWQDLGHYEVIWDGRDRFGSQAASGIYFAVYMAEGRTFARKMVMMK